MQLHNLTKLNRKSHKRVGRGGKRGSYSGRGQKGQKSRAGRRIRPAERDLILRLPKRRGFKNKPKTAKPFVFNLSDLSLALKTRADSKSRVAVNEKFLKQAGLLPLGYKGGVKILGGGEVEVPVQVEGIQVSKSAKLKIEKAGGAVK
jgi:large subunit ribosomal protein L15